MGKVQKWIHEKLEKNPGIQDQVKSLFEWLSKDLKNRIKDPEFYQKALTDYIDKTESAIKDLEASKDSEMDPTKKYEIATAIQKTRLAYTKWLMNLTQLHASESGNSALMMSIGHIRADITVAESTIHDDTRNSLKTS